jgi:hypothetical protein
MGPKKLEQYGAAILALVRERTSDSPCSLRACGRLRSQCRDAASHTGSVHPHVIFESSPRDDGQIQALPHPRR